MSEIVKEFQISTLECPKCKNQIKIRNTQDILDDFVLQGCYECGHTGYYVEVTRESDD